MERELQGHIIGPEIIVCRPNVVVMILRFRECVRNRNLEALRADLWIEAPNTYCKETIGLRENEDLQSGLAFCS